MVVSAGLRSGDPCGRQIIFPAALSNPTSLTYYGDVTLNYIIEDFTQKANSFFPMLLETGSLKYRQLSKYFASKI